MLGRSGEVLCRPVEGQQGYNKGLMNFQHPCSTSVESACNLVCAEATERQRLMMQGAESCTCCFPVGTAQVRLQDPKNTIEFDSLSRYGLSLYVRTHAAEIKGCKAVL